MACGQMVCMDELNAAAGLMPTIVETVRVIDDVDVNISNDDWQCCFFLGGGSWWSLLLLCA